MLNAAPSTDKAGFGGTPFHAATSAANRTTWWYAWDKYVLPDVYTDMPSELRAIREAVALIDMSPLPKMQVRGADAARLIDMLLTRSIARLETGRILYSPWCDAEGRLIGDGLVLRLEAERFIVSGEASHVWFLRHAAGLNVEVTDVSDDYGVLSLQGPNAFATLASATGRDWSDLKFSAIGQTSIAGSPVHVARQGFTGELGFEIWVPRKAGAAVWNAVLEAGAAYGALPAGEHAVDVARIEAGLILVSADYNGAGPDARCARVDVAESLYVTPFEAGLGQFVDLDRPFIGRDALAAERNNGRPGRRFVGLSYDAAEILALAAGRSALGTALSRVYWGSMTVFRDGEAVGRASSQCFSPTLRRAIGFGFLPAELADTGSVVEVAYRDDGGAVLGRVKATVTDLPFVKRRRSAS